LEIKNLGGKPGRPSSAKGEENDSPSTNCMTDKTDKNKASGRNWASKFRTKKPDFRDQLKSKQANLTTVLQARNLSRGRSAAPQETS